MSTQNRRQFSRVPLTTMVQWRFSSVDDFLSAPSLDISEGGMFVKSDAPRAVGSRLVFKLKLGAQEQVIEGTAEVMRVIPAGQEGSGMGLKFVMMDEGFRQLIRAWVDHHAGK